MKVHNPKLIFQSFVSINATYPGCSNIPLDRKAEDVASKQDICIISGILCF